MLLNPNQSFLVCITSAANNFNADIEMHDHSQMAIVVIFWLKYYVFLLTMSALCCWHVFPQAPF